MMPTPFSRSAESANNCFARAAGPSSDGSSGMHRGERASAHAAALPASAARLTGATLDALASPTVRPRYDRERVARGIVHLGLGAFHRAHQAVHTEHVLAQGDPRWGICGVSLRSAAVRDTLLEQDMLYSVTERFGEQVSSRVIGALIEVRHAPSELDAVLDALADSRVSVVTLTVTEKGYCRHPSTGELDGTHPDIAHDLTRPRMPRSTLGVLAEGIRRRDPRAPLTVVCCDNMADNGEVLRALLLAYCERVEPALARRIDGDIAFPNSMVDRIVPAATQASLDWAVATLGVRDAAAIVCEPFMQWVIEDRFAGPRPAWEAAGAVLTADVRPYQQMKLRLLNGSHSAIAYLGQLAGCETVSDAMASPLLGPFVRALMRRDLRDTVVAPAGYDTLGYCDDLLHRFENPSTHHRTEQIAMDGTQKVPVRWLPALRESVAAGIERPWLERALAAWFGYLLRASDTARLAAADPGAPALVERMRAGGEHPRSIVRGALGQSTTFGAEPWPEAFVERVATYVDALRARGVAGLLAGLPTR